MSIYKGNIENQTLHNNYWRKVIHTTPQLQLVLMSVDAGQELGSEVHHHTTQFIRVEEGTGVAYVGGHRYNLKSGDAIIVPAGIRHNVRATTGLKLYTIYSPPHHPRNRKQRTKP